MTSFCLTQRSAGISCVKGLGPRTTSTLTPRPQTGLSAEPQLRLFSSTDAITFPTCSQHGFHGINSQLPGSRVQGTLGNSRRNPNTLIPYSSTEKLPYAFALVTLMTYVPSRGSSLSWNDRSAMPSWGITSSHCSIRLSLGSYTHRRGRNSCPSISLIHTTQKSSFRISVLQTTSFYS